MKGEGGKEGEGRGSKRGGKKTQLRTLHNNRKTPPNRGGPDPDPPPPLSERTYPVLAKLVQ